MVLLLLTGVRPAAADQFVLELGMDGNNQLDITRNPDLSAFGELKGQANEWSWKDVNTGIETKFTNGILDFSTTNFTLTGTGFAGIAGTVDYQTNTAMLIGLGAKFNLNSSTYVGDIAFTYAGGSGVNLPEKGGSGTFTMMVPEASTPFMLFAACLFVLGLVKTSAKS
jgi:hypothetical protein